MTSTNKQAPAYLIVSLVLTGIFLLIASINLKMNSRNFEKEFYSQNFSSIENNDSFGLIPQLNGLSNQGSIDCIEGSQDGLIFFSTKTKCSTHIFSERIVLTSQNKRLSLLFGYKLPRMVIAYIAAIYLFAMAFLLSLLFLLFRIQRIENNYLRIFNNLALRVSHDIRSPLSALSILSNTSDINSPEARELLKKASSRIHAIAQDLLDSTKSVKDRNLRIQKVELNSLISDLVREKNLAIHESDEIQVFFENPTSKIFASCDKIEILRMMSNLLNNSIEAKRPEHSLTVQIYIRQIADAAEIDIVDNGKGIPKKILRKLGKVQLTSRGEGFGIGTYNAFQLMTRMNGKILYKSILGKGTTVTLRLPS